MGQKSMECQVNHCLKTSQWVRFGALWVSLLIVFGDGWVAQSAFGQTTEALEVDQRLGEGNRGRWDTVGSLAARRSQHSATPLSDGRLLICGGVESSGALAGCEVYEPRSGVFTQSASMLEGRWRHASVGLPSGQVLVIGGIGEDGEAVGSTELYDPRADRWVAAPPLNQARTDHTATLLGDGRVLVIGGIFEGRILASVELWVEGTWRQTTPLPISRRYHSATLTADGRVLVVGGGTDIGDDLTTALLFDPATEDWLPAGDLQVGRRWHTATRLRDGRVVVAGGRGPADRDLQEVEIYDPVSNIWTEGPELSIPRYWHRANLLPSGEVLVTGGISAGGTVSLDTHELFDPATHAWSATASSNERRHDHTTTVLQNGDLLTVGGRQQLSGTLAHAENFALDAGVWVSQGTSYEVPPMGTPRYGARSVLLPDGRALVVGGRDAHGGLPAVAEIFDPTQRTWAEVASPSMGRIGHFAIGLVDGRVLVGGGIDGDQAYLRSTEVYDPVLDAWQSTADMPVARDEPGAVTLADGRVLVVGGWNETIGLASTEIYDPTLDRWRVAAPLNTGRRYHSTTRLADGRVLVAGGSNPTGTQISSEVYDPEIDRWHFVGPLSSRRSRHSATLLANGRILVVGGQSVPETLSSAELFDPISESWIPTGKLSEARSRHHTVPLFSGKVLVFGGRGDDGRAVASSELFDPATGRFTDQGSFDPGRERGGALLLPTGEILLAGGRDPGGTVFEETHLFVPNFVGPSRPVLEQWPGVLAYGDGPWTLVGGSSVFPEASDGTTGQSPSQGPRLSLVSLGSGATARLTDVTVESTGGPWTFRLGGLPEGLEPGTHALVLEQSGVPSVARLVDVGCRVSITAQPVSPDPLSIGQSATFAVVALGARTYRWQQSTAGPGGPWIDIPGATVASYTTPPVTGPEAGTLYRAVVSNGCDTEISEPVAVSIDDAEDPQVTVETPNGGEFFLLANGSTGAEGDTLVAAWALSDNVRICRVRVDLLASTDGGTTYAPIIDDFWPFEASAGNPSGDGVGCAHPGTSVSNVGQGLTDLPPSGVPGSLYKLRVRAWDHSGRAAEDTSDSPFFIVEPDLGSTRTLIVTHSTRMAGGEALERDLRTLADHPRVAGAVIDLAEIGTLEGLYRAWDDDPGDASKANAVLFGTPLEPGLQDILLDQLRIFPAVDYLVLVGGDDVIPMARMGDLTRLVREDTYIASGELSTATTVGKALGAGFYLSDDPIAVLDTVDAVDLSTDLFVPDLLVGRLVEKPSDIRTVIATFLGKDGALDLTDLDPVTGSKVLVTGYDFLSDLGRTVRDRLRASLDLSPHDGSTPPQPVAGDLLGEGWGGAQLTAAVCGNGGEPYGLWFINGHANHFVIGYPGTGPFDVQGVDTGSLLGADTCGPDRPLRLAGSVIVSPGCHGALPVPGENAVDHPQDLPETLLARGALAYVSNTGYGWGLVHGIGYGERLVELLSEEWVAGGAVPVGVAVRSAKRRYVLETPQFDAYDTKSLMQWTLFGLPMATVQVAPSPTQGERVGTLEGSVSSARSIAQLPEREVVGGVVIHRSPVIGSPVIDSPVIDSPVIDQLSVDGTGGNPANLAILSQSFDFSAPGLYVRRDATGAVVEPEDYPCPHPKGCYDTLLGLGSRGIGQIDQPIEPFFVFDSRLAGTSQHGVLWLGGEFVQEEGWKPIFSVPQTNEVSDHVLAAAPRRIMIDPTATRLVPGIDPSQCQPSDTELNSLVIPTGESLSTDESAADGSFDYGIHRRYRRVDLETFYFHDPGDPEASCDRSGPVFGEPTGGGPGYHVVDGSSLRWSVPARDLENLDTASDGVWRVVAVVDDGRLDASGHGSWDPVELAYDFDLGLWTGEYPLGDTPSLTYALQAVDRRGNVSWYDYVTATRPELPSSGVPLEIPMPLEVTGIPQSRVDVSITLEDLPDPVAPGLPALHTATVTNHGPDPASGLELQVAVSADLRIAAVGEGWQCTSSPIASKAVVCGLASLASGDRSTVRLYFAAPDTEGTFTLEAAVSSRDLESNPLDNRAVETTTVAVQETAASDLSLRASSTPEVFTAGALGVYHLWVENLGPDTAAGPLVVDLELPADTEERAVTGGDGPGTSWHCTASPPSVSCAHPGPLGPGLALPALALTVRLADDAASVGLLRATVLRATVSSPSEDMDPGNNHVELNTRILGYGADSVCDASTFDTPDPSFVGAVLGDAARGTHAWVDGTVHITADGSTAWAHADNLYFLHRPVDGDFRAEVDLTDLPVDSGGTYRKALLAVRASLDPWAPRLFIGHLPGVRGLQFGVRTAQDGEGTALVDDVSNVDLPVRLAIERRGDTYSVYYAQDGAWRRPPGGSVTFDLGETPLVGLGVSAVSSDQTMTAAFDDFLLCGPNTVPAVVPVEPGACDASRALDVTVVLDASGAMGAPFEGSTSRYAAAREALLELTERIAARDDETRMSLVTVHGVWSAAWNLENAVHVRVPPTADLDGFAAAVESLDESSLDPDHLRPSALGLRRVSEGLRESADPGRRAVVVWLTAGLPDVDVHGRGPEAYPLSELDAIPLRDFDGYFLPWTTVAWQGSFHGETGAYAGLSQAHVMFEAERLRDGVDTVRVYPMALQDPSRPFDGELWDYVAHVTAGRAFSVQSLEQLRGSLLELETALSCPADPCPGFRWPSPWVGSATDVPDR